MSRRTSLLSLRHRAVRVPAKNMDGYLLFVLAVLSVGAVLLWRSVRSVSKLRVDSDKLAADIKAGKRPAAALENPKNGTISIIADGFALSRNGDRLAEVRWDRVREIRAYKADMLATDLICWEFRGADEDRRVEVHEEMSGFDKLQEAVRSRFGVALEDGFSRVAFPAFATNMTVLWPKGDGAPSATSQPPYP